MDLAPKLSPDASLKWDSAPSGSPAQTSFAS